MISSGYSYKVKYVDHRTTKTGKNITAFSIGDKIKDSNPTEYVNWHCTVWSKMELQDGQAFKIEKIVNIICDIYNGKRQYKLTLEGKPVTGNDDDEFTPPQDEPVRRSNTVTDTGKQAEPFFPGVDDTELKLPFDI